MPPFGIGQALVGQRCLTESRVEKSDRRIFVGQVGRCRLDLSPFNAPISSAALAISVGLKMLYFNHDLQILRNQNERKADVDTPAQA
jgi:hypothetical protein